MRTSRTNKNKQFGTVRSGSPNRSEQGEGERKVDGKISIGFKADRVADADLIEWWESLNKGGRSDALRAIFRNAKSGDSEQLTSLATEMIELRNEMAEISTQLGRFLVQVFMGELVPATVKSTAESAEIGQELIEKRQRNLNQAKW